MNNDPDFVLDNSPAELAREDVSETLDEDRLGLDPLEAGSEPPERWTAVDRVGTTAAEQREGESLTDRLAEEEPDAPVPEPPGRPLANTPDTELDESIDDIPADAVPIMPVEDIPRRHSQGANQRQTAADGSVAEAIRTPPGD